MDVQYGRHTVKASTSTVHDTVRYYIHPLPIANAAQTSGSGQIKKILCSCCGVALLTILGSVRDHGDQIQQHPISIGGISPGGVAPCGIVSLYSSPRPQVQSELFCDTIFERIIHTATHVCGQVL